MIKAKVKVEFSLKKVWKWQCFDCELLEIWQWLKVTRRRGIVVMDFDCYTDDRGSIPTHGDSLVNKPSLGSTYALWGNWVVSPRYWQDIDLHSVYNCENGLLSLRQVIYIYIYNKGLFTSVLLTVSKKRFHDLGWLGQAGLEKRQRCTITYLKHKTKGIK